jgi:hypothetical protein
MTAASRTITFPCALLAASILFSWSVTSAQQQASPKASGPRRSGPAVEQYRVVASVKDVMESILEPATEVIFDAVSPIPLPDGSLEKMPGSAQEWAAVRSAALVLAEGGNLLMMRGRSIDRMPRRGEGARRGASVEGMPDVAERVHKARADWTRLAQGLVAAGQLTLRAAEGRDARGLLAAGNAIDAACEACHQRFWYRF